MTPPPDQPLPYATVRLTDDGEAHGQAVEVIVDGKPVALLNACRVGYELTVNGRGILHVGLRVREPVEIDAGDVPEGDSA